MNNLTLKEKVIERWKQGQGIARIQREMMITINLFDKSLFKLNDAILKGRFEVLGMNGERPFKITNDDIAEFKREIVELKDKLHRRNMQIKELKKNLQLAIADGLKYIEIECLVKRPTHTESHTYTTEELFNTVKEIVNR